VVGPGAVQSQVKAVVEVDRSILEVVVLSILVADLAYLAEVLQSPPASVVGRVGRLMGDPYCQNQAYQGEVANRHLPQPAEVCERGLGL
jgi:hypothetical protein